MFIIHQSNTVRVFTLNTTNSLFYIVHQTYEILTVSNQIILERSNYMNFQRMDLNSRSVSCLYEALQQREPTPSLINILYFYHDSPLFHLLQDTAASLAYSVMNQI